MRPAAIAGLATVLAACTPMQWVKPEGAAPEQLSQDMAQCQLQAWREAQWRYWMYRPLGPLFVRDRFGHPFAFWPYGPYGPYGPYSDPFYDPFLEEQRLMHFCLRAKGYELVPVGPKK